MVRPTDASDFGAIKTSTAKVAIFELLDDSCNHQYTIPYRNSISFALHFCFGDITNVGFHFHYYQF